MEVDQRVVALVRGLAPLTAPDGEARDRMRARILAGFAAPEPDSGPDDLDSDSDLDQGSPPALPERPKPATGPAPQSRRPRRWGSRPGGSDRGSSRPGENSKPGAGLRGRFAIAAVAMLALVASLAGMSLLLARDALPGDTLYGIKRTAEAASLGLTFGDESKAVKHLEFAAARVTEIETLARRYPNPDDAPVGLYLTAMSDFDTDTAAAARQLIALATQRDGRQLQSLREWARTQAVRLEAAAGGLPAAARHRTSTSLALLTGITARADALLDRMPCYQITTGSFDAIGALPATGRCERVPGADNDRRSAPSLSDSQAPPEPPLTSAPTAPLPPTQTPPLPGAGPSAVPGAPGSPEPGAPATGQTPVSVPLPLPPVELPPLLPGLPGIRLGG
ncbi:MAG TPA: DUF5667 domain-containing protein [Actinophytocola sp.]|uniref:DUF5667 domain-containing protein n=1 Tax=Actinophytocola sp. TaxID=1872138 RepID=UPI002DB5B07F|nr:DUF5667 domain-containing protein [Actinophytocola sp.]HEU5469813.1 DUF5667 domain-containing protein [Actinophytocola sp.]